MAIACSDAHRVGTFGKSTFSAFLRCKNYSKRTRELGERAPNVRHMMRFSSAIFDDFNESPIDFLYISLNSHDPGSALSDSITSC